MPLLIALGLIIAVFLMTVLILPFAIIFRFHYGTKRRRARVWVATLNTFFLALSAATFLISAAITSRWVPDAFSYSAAGLATGGILGLIGLVLSRWEYDRGALYYTPSRLLVLAITLVVTARIGYGLWRGWNAWRASPDDGSWIAAVGIAGSMAAGAIVVGYYLVYWAGVRSHARL